MLRTDFSDLLLSRTLLAQRQEGHDAVFGNIAIFVTKKYLHRITTSMRELNVSTEMKAISQREKKYKVYFKNMIVKLEEKMLKLYQTQFLRDHDF